MMINTSIIYHSESILEMQFLCLIVFAFYGYIDFSHEHQEAEINRRA